MDFEISGFIYFLYFSIVLQYFTIKHLIWIILLCWLWLPFLNIFELFIVLKLIQTKIFWSWFLNLFPTAFRPVNQFKKFSPREWNLNLWAHLNWKFHTSTKYKVKPNWYAFLCKRLPLYMGFHCTCKFLKLCLLSVLWAGLPLLTCIYL